MLRTLIAAALLTFPLPALADCAADIARFQKLIDGDLKTGFIGKGVYAQASESLKQASRQCKAGEDTAASAAVAATRARHGYPP